MEEIKKDAKSSLNLRLIVACFLVLLGSGLLIAGFTVPPLGIIDNSVLISFGEISTFAAAVLGIDYSYKYKVYKYLGDEITKRK
jgi:hypothetical protein